MQTFVHITHVPASVPQGPMTEVHLVTHQTIYIGKEPRDHFTTVRFHATPDELREIAANLLTIANSCKESI